MEGPDKQPAESTTQSFVVRIWIEEIVAGTSAPVWRGHITHVPDGQRLYITDLNGIVTFITPYLKKMGVQFGLRWRIRHWLNRWRL